MEVVKREVSTTNFDFLKVVASDKNIVVITSYSIFCSGSVAVITLTHLPYRWKGLGSSPRGIAPPVADCVSLLGQNKGTSVA